MTDAEIKPRIEAQFTERKPNIKRKFKECDESEELGITKQKPISFDEASGSIQLKDEGLIENEIPERNNLPDKMKIDQEKKEVSNPFQKKIEKNVCSTITIIGHKLPNHQVYQLLEQNPDLECLAIIRRNMYSLIKPIMRLNKKLKVLKIKDSCSLRRHSINFKHIVELLSKLEYLEELSFKNCYIRGKIMKYFETKPLNLQKISFIGQRNLTETDATELIIKNCKNLKSITLLSDKLYFNDDDIKIISNEIGSNLIKIKIGAAILTDASIDYLIRNNKNLKAVHFKQPYGFTNSALQRLLQLTNVTKLCLTDDNRPWRNFFEHSMKGLQKLNLSRSTTVNELTLEKITHFCTSLEELNLSFCENITTKGVETLLNCCKLKKLNLLSTSINTKESLSYITSLILKKGMHFDLMVEVEKTEQELKQPDES